MLAAGITRHAVQWAVRTGELVRLRRGAFTTGELWQKASPEQRHVLHLVAYHRLQIRGASSGTSAAIALGLPTPVGPPEFPQITLGRTPRARIGAQGRRGGTVRRRARMVTSDVWQLNNGIWVTSPERTVIDCAREWPQLWGLAIADAAIKRGLVTRQQLLDAVAAKTGVPGTEKAKWVAEHARPLVESPLESLSRGVIVLGGFPEPTPQVWLQTRLGKYRVDLLDEQNRLITEADGKLKYETAGDLWREKRREDALRETGHGLIRFTMPDYYDQEVWLASYRRRLGRAKAGE